MIIHNRPEIDGLRAIAILAVVLYHMQIIGFDYYFFKGGFIGVDIFFVISGYLITSIIYKQLLITGSFSLKYFYKRRIIRLLPALFFVIAVFIPITWIYLTPASFSNFSKEILHSLGFTSNIFFYFSGLEYGNDDGWLKPFLHTWSLSVEGQYYLIFPIFLLLIFKFLRKYLIYILIFGFFLSLSLAVWGSKNYPALNQAEPYY